jgi:hypothetical protein
MRDRPGTGELVPRHRSADSLTVGSPSLTCGPSSTPSLSPNPIKDISAEDFSPLPFISPPRGETLPASHRWLAPDWHHHFCFASVWLIPESLQLLCPRFRYHRPTPSPPIADHASDVRPPPIRALPITPHCRQVPPTCF